MKKHSFHIVSSDSPEPEIMQKLCLSTKFPHQEIKWNFGISSGDSVGNPAGLSQVKFLKFYEAKGENFFERQMQITLKPVYLSPNTWLWTFYSLDGINHVMRLWRRHHLKFRYSHNFSFKIKTSCSYRLETTNCFVEKVKLWTEVIYLINNYTCLT